MSNQTIAQRRHTQLIVALCLFVFCNISCFTLVTSFTKSNFLTAIQTSTTFRDVYNQKPYFFLYGFSGVCFTLFYLIYHVAGPRTSFEHRIKRDILFLAGGSLALYLMPVFFPGFQKRFLPAAIYFVVYDILDDLIIVQTWTLINYAIDIRQSKKVQNLFLFSGGVAAFISGLWIIRLVPEDKQTFFLLLAMLFAGISYGIVSHIFFLHRTRIYATISAEKMSLKTLFQSQKKYRIIRSIVLITVLAGVFNLFFKVLYDTQINVRYPAVETTAEAAAAYDPSDMPDPKTEFIGQYKAVISILQVILQLVFVYFFSRIWLNGRILLAYPILLIPMLAFILWAYAARESGLQHIVFWSTIAACGINELIRRIIFDAAYQLLMFSIPERLCNALRLYARLLIKPLIIILICGFFVMMPPQTNPFPLYCGLLMMLLAAMTVLATRIPGEYIASLKSSVLRRLPVERALNSLVRLEANYIVEQYQKVVADSDDRFGCLYILNIIRSNYTPDLDGILEKLLENSDRDVRLETVSMVRELGVRRLSSQLEQRFFRESDQDLKRACLETVAAWGPTNEGIALEWMDMDLPFDFRKYVLAAAYRTESPGLMEQVSQASASYVRSSNPDEILTGIWLIGELKLSHLIQEIRRHFDMKDPRAYPMILDAAASLDDFALFTACLRHIGYERLEIDEAFERNLAGFGTRSFEIICDMLEEIVRTKSHFELKKSLRALFLMPSRETVDFLAGVLARYHAPIIREEAFNCIARIKTADPHLDYSVFMERLPEEIRRCRTYCRYCQTVALSNPESLMLIELERNIEHQIWAIFKVFDMFYPDLAIFDSYYRITQTSRQASTSHVKAKSIEYLESLIRERHPDFLELLESIRFEEGFIAEVTPLSGPPLNVMSVYEDILTQSDHWLEISALLDMPPSMRDEFTSGSKEMEDMIPVMEKIHFLRKVPLFRGFSIADMIVIAQIAQEVRFEAGGILFRKGDPGDALYLILEGEVDILGEGREILVNLGPTSCFGEVSVLDKKGRTASAVCVNDCRMLMIASSDFQEILERYPVLYKNIVQVLTGWLRDEQPSLKKGRD